MKWLVLIHVLSAIIGVGPTYFSHILLRKNQSLQELRISTKYSKMLEFFPKIGGTIAVLTGLLLVILNDYGKFTQLWLIGSLVLYILIQVMVLGVIMPRANKIAAWLNDPKNNKAAELPSELRKVQESVHNLFYIPTLLGTLLFIFMILKPTL